MKKKMRNITYGEIINVCRKQSGCMSCPLLIANKMACLNYLTAIDITEDDLNKEVEYEIPSKIL